MRTLILTLNAASSKISPVGLKLSAMVAASILVLLTIGPRITVPMQVATLTYFALLAGYTLRRDSIKAHALLMTAGIMTDLGLVLVLAVQRHAISTAISLTLTPLQQAHVLCSTVATLLYLPALVFGAAAARRRGPRGSGGGRLHARVAGAALFFRTLGFLSMFSMLGR